MLKRLKKKPPAKIKLPKTATAAITCGGCGRVREPTATNPEWQCPCCGKAYTRVNVTRKEQFHRARDQSRAQEQAKHEAKKVEQQTPGGLYAGLITFVAGMGSACSGAAASPLVPAAGVSIALGAAVYGIDYYLF